MFTEYILTLALKKTSSDFDLKVKDLEKKIQLGK